MMKDMKKFNVSYTFYKTLLSISRARFKIIVSLLLNKLCIYKKTVGAFTIYVKHSNYLS